MKVLFRWLAAEEAERRVGRLVLLWLPLSLLQFVATQRLWLASSEYPQVPLVRFPFESAMGASVGQAVLFLLLVLSIVVAFASRLAGVNKSESRSLLVVTATLVLLFVFNQHRIQPWAYLFALFTAVIGLSKVEWTVPLLRALVIGVYLHSACSKFDFEFLTTTGNHFMQELLRIVGINNAAIWSKHFGPALFPATELLTGVGLFAPRTRSLAVVVGVMMHLVLLFVLGPLGLAHLPAVLIWNVVFVVFLIVLFWEPPRATRCQLPMIEPCDTDLRTKLATSVVAAAVFLPCLHPFGLYDHWPSWGLYAPSNSRVAVFIADDSVEQLPTRMRAYLSPLRFNDPEFPQPVQFLNVARWSLDDLRVPIYPQDRFQLGVAIGLANRYQLGDDIHVQAHSRSGRMNGARTSRLLNGNAALREFAQEFRLNALPAAPADKIR